MLTRLWRMSHLALSLVVVLFLLLASITGIILSFDPIQKEWAPLSVKGARSLSVAEVLFNINGHFETILDIEILENDAVKISTMDMDSSKDGDFIIDPFSASRLGDVPHSNNFFQWVTSLHRSLFLKRTGRFIVGLSSFLFSLIIITGIVLIVKREGSWLGLFRKTIRTRSDQYLHLTVSKCTWIPLFIIAITGVYLSLLRFDVIPEPDKVSFIPLAKDVSGTNELSAYDFPIFQQLPITKIKKLEFPFSDDAIDPYILYTKHERYIVHQYSGEILEAYRDPIINKISTWSNRLHTGQGSVIWSLILGGSTSGILFLVYTGFSISWQRLRGKETQLFGAQEAEIILLYGSENGSTRRFANALFKALIGAKQKVFLDTLNNYTSFPYAKTILVLTATYGDGEAPSNASDFYD
ncbi:MAG: PepSY domain-containing protein [Saprospiraceae bacterium]|nr:PepSY domain-containing protein [Saprospiraceae bacterium]